MTEEDFINVEQALSIIDGGPHQYSAMFIFSARAQVCNFAKKVLAEARRDFLTE